MTIVKRSKPKKKLTKSSNSEKKSIKRIPQLEWLLIVGGAIPPVISGSTSVCTPSQETYSVSDPGTHTFLWSITNGTIVGSATNSTVTVDWTGTSQGTVDVTITSGSGCTNTNNITVDKYATPIIGTINSSNELTRR